jgi:hypothetical protein
MKTEDQEERKRKRLEAETLKKFPYFKSIQFAVFNVNENDIRKGRKAVIEKYGPAGWKNVKDRMKTGIMEIFRHKPTRETKLFAETCGMSADARIARKYSLEVP